SACVALFLPRSCARPCCPAGMHCWMSWAVMTETRCSLCWPDPRATRASRAMDGLRYLALIAMAAPMRCSSRCIKATWTTSNTRARS
ncbi:hypothetical protein FBU31_007078, partial [Coemansia sp. 'formosensis']